MTKGAQIGIALGVTGVVGIIIYMVFKPKAAAAAVVQPVVVSTQPGITTGTSTSTSANPYAQLNAPALTAPVVAPVSFTLPSGATVSGTKVAAPAAPATGLRASSDQAKYGAPYVANPTWSFDGYGEAFNAASR